MRLAALLALIVTTASVAEAYAQSAPFEPDAIINDGISRDIIGPAVGMIRAHGWRCDSISALRPFLMSRGFVVVCNNFNYTYNFEDRGGNWVVELG